MSRNTKRMTFEEAAERIALKHDMRAIRAARRAKDAMVWAMLEGTL